MPDTNEQRSWEMHKCVGCERIFSGPHVLGHMTPAGDRCRSQATQRITVYEQPEALVRAADALAQVVGRCNWPRQSPLAEAHTAYLAARYALHPKEKP